MKFNTLERKLHGESEKAFVKICDKRGLDELKSDLEHNPQYKSHMVLIMLFVFNINLKNLIL